MTAVVISLTERRLGRHGIKITFFKAVMRQSAVVLRYPGGLNAFLEKYPNTERKAGLIAVTFMSLQQSDQFCVELRAHAIRRGREFALANQIDGVVDECSGIKFMRLERSVNRGALGAFPVWYACPDNNSAEIERIH